MSYGTLASTRFTLHPPLPGWNLTSLYRPEVLFANWYGGKYFLLPWRGAVEIKPEPIDWSIVGGVKFAPLEFQYTHSHLFIMPVKEAGVFKCAAGETTYYEVELEHRAKSTFEHAARVNYTFDDQGRSRPLRAESEPTWRAKNLDEIGGIDKFYVLRQRPQQLPKPGSAYLGRQGSFSVTLIFDEMSRVASASFEGDEVQYVRYYAVGSDSGALLAVAYTIGGEAHFLVLMEFDGERIATRENTFHDMYTIELWDDIGAGMAIMADERPILPTGRLPPRGMQPPEFDSQGLDSEELSPYRGREWLFGMGDRQAEYFIVPIRPLRGDEGYRHVTDRVLLDDITVVRWPYYNELAYTMPPTRATIHRIDHKGATHYYEAFVDTSPENERCFFGLHEWKYPVSEGQMEKSLKNRILSMNHPITKDLNRLCKGGYLVAHKGLNHMRGTVLDDGQAVSGNYTGVVGKDDLRLEFDNKTVTSLGGSLLARDFDTIAYYPLLYVLVVAAYRTGPAGREGKVVVLRPSETGMIEYVHANMTTGVFKLYSKQNLARWDTVWARRSQRFLFDERLNASVLWPS